MQRGAVGANLPQGRIAGEGAPTVNLIRVPSGENVRSVAVSGRLSSFRGAFPS